MPKLVLVILLLCCYSTAIANSYTAENTLKKLISDYPFISIASAKPPTSVAVHKDLTYVTYGDRSLQLDLYQPSSLNEARPLVILVHGGGWQAGYRTHLTPIAIELAKAGYNAATISYRLATEALYPAAIHDAKAAIRWLRAHAVDFHLDEQKFAIAGSSAGGQIASLTGATNGLDKFDPQAQQSSVSSDVQLIINIDGLSDFTSAKARKYEDAPRDKPTSAVLWLGGHYAEQTENWHEASPIFYANEYTPPMLFIASGRTRFYVGREEMIRRLNQYNIHTEVVTFAETPHSFWLFDPWMKPAADVIVEFLDKELE
ncbi:alpha/beta hydrolase [Gilvimarinus sp. SDUM040013]|uniref:Alpha/beta hydrolase n=1 Tax=Gilvimarinus gilvus TaxID=3058038 RepID=A0ABU4RX43_9GAMM|nr:alpha/beta hydrolase [Gilvimarinus sp. SDUM040013]MDO3386647.1 alpha/beta hydrolase [Gilvimarinus sp. SDUM040013]MDX6849466.1 alpha/beta hydrolase [Gilvimarinus sp. SDUM040013]